MQISGLLATSISGGALRCKATSSLSTPFWVVSGYDRGQLTDDLRRYHAEIDSSLSPDEMETRVKISKRYAKARFEYRVLLRHYGGPWVCERWPMCVLPFLGTKAFKAEHWRLSLMARFDKEIRQIKKRLTTAENAAVVQKRFRIESSGCRPFVSVG